MKKHIARGLVVVALAAMLSGSAQAAPCNGHVTQVDSAAGTLYIDDRDATAGGVWVYQESNNIPGLQSGGASVLLGELDVDTCNEGPNVRPDTLLV